MSKLMPAEQLSLLPLFKNTSPDVLARWLERFPCAITTLQAGDSVDTNAPRALGVLLEGRLEIQSSDSGRCVILRELSAPDLFGAAALFCENDAPLSHVKSKGRCTLLFIPLEAVRVLLAEDEAFREGYLSFLAGRVQFLNRKIRCFTAGSAERRLALWLAAEREAVPIPTSMSALADMLDIGRASLYRALDTLEGEGLIRRDGRTVTVLSQEKLLKKYQ
jgi:CRP-like cAMP-binding protein